ncbi:MAG: HAD family hydrolase [Bacteroidales bacterium]|nr:HAD family hydrolase [Bacteroidales bacterium]MCF8328542.1 HAD family hydrolase [Bacteroidales bacterium]
MQRKNRRSLSQVDRVWSLFLDRDGVINQRIWDGYVTNKEDFQFIEGVQEALKIFSDIFQHIVVVTNQQGIGKGLMKTEDLDIVHEKMLKSVEETGGRIDNVYFCPDLKEHQPFCRKPQVGMALQAQKDYPEINLKKSIMVGDTLNDMIFGRRLNMITVLVGKDQQLTGDHYKFIDYSFDNLLQFAKTIYNQVNSKNCV